MLKQQKLKRFDGENTCLLFCFHVFLFVVICYVADLKLTCMILLFSNTHILILEQTKSTVSLL